MDTTKINKQIDIKTIKTSFGAPIYLAVYEAGNREMYENLLTVSEQEYLNDIKEEKRINSLIGRVVAKYTAAEYVKNRSNLLLDFTQIDILSRVGKPPVCAFKDVSKEIIPPRISISHCNSCAVAIAVDGSVAGGVGIDIEQVRQWNKETVAGFLNPDEEAYCALRPDIYMERVTLFWCLKEAYLKAVGTGIYTHPLTVSVHIAGDDEQKITLKIKGQTILAQIFWTRDADECIITSVIL